MSTYWLIGKGDSTAAVSQLSLKSIEESLKIHSNMSEMDAITEEGRFDNGTVDTQEINQNGIKHASEDCNKNVISRATGNGCPANGELSNRGQAPAANTRVNVSPPPSINKQYLHLETSNQNGKLKGKKKNTVQSSACVIL